MLDRLTGRNLEQTEDQDPVTATDPAPSCIGSSADPEEMIRQSVGRKGGLLARTLECVNATEMVSAAKTGKAVAVAAGRARFR